MELVDLALRLCAVRALRGATYCGAKVFDSEILPIESVVERESTPFISVYTDSSKSESVDGKDMLGAQRLVDLTLEVAVTSVGTEDDDTPALLQRTDAAIEAQLNFISRQIHRALFAANGGWGDLFKRFFRGVHRVETYRGAMAEGQRFAARKICFTLNALAEPPYGAPVGPWATLLEMMRADAGLTALADLFENEITSTALEEWQLGVADLGLTLEQWDVFGLTNLGGEPYAPQDGDEEALDASLDQTTPADDAFISASKTPNPPEYP